VKRTLPDQLWSGDDIWVDGYGALVARHYAELPVRVGMPAGRGGRRRQVRGEAHAARRQHADRHGDDRAGRPQGAARRLARPRRRIFATP
jgi:hypothetical protein